MWSFENRIILVTGSVKRIGLEMVRTFAEKGAIPILHYRSSEDEAQKALEEIRKTSPKTILIQGDHSNLDDVKKMVREIESHFGKLDALVNSASVFPSIPFHETDENDFEDIINANLKGPFFLTQAALPLLQKADAAQIVNIVDDMNAKPSSGYAAYFASKGALETLTLSLAKELAPEIRVNGVAPGPVVEPEGMSDERRERIIARLPLKKWGSAEAVVQAVVAVMENEFMTGTILQVDGGRSIG